MYQTAISPCPNDTFIFYAMLHNKVDCEGLQFDPVFADVEMLNNEAAGGRYDITKLSFHAWLLLRDKYLLLDSGAALGKGCGPLLIAKKYMTNDELSKQLVAIPGEHTTAHLLLKIFYPEIKNKSHLLFSEIEKAILNNDVGAGVIIHENRFTYAAKGLLKIADLGECWENETNSPIPLGGIFTAKEKGEEFNASINRIVHRSILYACENVKETMDFVRLMAQEMNDDVIQQHIDLYVNDFTLSLGAEGNKAIDLLTKKINSLLHSSQSVNSI